MSDCSKYEDFCSLYIDDMLLNTEIEELLEHLDTCESCTQYYSELKNIKENIKNIKIEYPEDLSISILEKIQQNKDVQIVHYTPPKKKAFYALLASCACIAITLGISSSGFSFSQTNKASYSVDMSETIEYSINDATNDISLASSMDIDESIQVKISDLPANSYDHENPIAISVYGSDVPIEPQVESEILLDEYSFVYKFKGISNINDITGKILYVNDDVTYLEVENTISNIEKVIKTLEANQYSMIETDQNEFIINTDSPIGIFIIYKN